MIIRLLWIVTGLLIALSSGLPNGDLSGISRELITASWHLSLASVLGLLLAAEGCRMFQFGWFAWRN
jgi:hypothetical protein